MIPSIGPVVISIREAVHRGKAVEIAVDEVMELLTAIEESNSRPGVAIVALPVALIERVWNAKVDSDGAIEKEDDGGSDAPNFRGLLKARAMHLRFPIQIVWEDVLDERAVIPGKVKESSGRKIQDEAGRSWNIMTSLYYKRSGRIPWRRMPQEGKFSACYLVISFLPRGRRATTVHHRRPNVRRALARLHPKGTASPNRNKGPPPFHDSGRRQGADPGMYDPRPLLLSPHKTSDSAVAQIAREVLSMTKINWNSTQMNRKLRLPIRAARKVGEVLKYVADGNVSSG